MLQRTVDKSLSARALLHIIAGEGGTRKTRQAGGGRRPGILDSSLGTLHKLAGLATCFVKFAAEAEKQLSDLCKLPPDNNLRDQLQTISKLKEDSETAWVRINKVVERTQRVLKKKKPGAGAKPEGRTRRRKPRT